MKLQYLFVNDVREQADNDQVLYVLTEEESIRIFKIEHCSSF